MPLANIIDPFFIMVNGVNSENIDVSIIPEIMGPYRDMFLEVFCLSNIRASYLPVRPF
jgi:hypothetical protein